VIEPMIGVDSHPEIAAFLTAMGTELDAEFEAADWTAEHNPNKTLYYWQWSHDEKDCAFLLVHFGSDDPADWATIQVGVLVHAKTQESRDKWHTALELMTNGALPKGTRVRANGKDRVTALASFGWSRPTELDDLRATLCATIRHFRSSLEPALQNGE
jgi:hypothetical protein